MTTEKLIEQILGISKEASRETLLKRLEKERKKTGGLISDEVLLRMIAAELGVQLSQNEALALTLSIRDLIPSLYDVTIVGRVVAVFPPKTFEGKRSGKLASLLVADRDSLLRVVMWNDKTSLVESGKIRVGQIVRFEHGYTREDRSGKVELHVGDKCEIEVNPQGVKAEEYPTIGKFVARIADVVRAGKNKTVNVKGTVRDVFPASVFQRQDSSGGKVMRLMLADDTGEVSVVVWNEKADELEKALKKGAELQIVNGRVKKAMGDGLEIHVNSGTYVELLPPAEKFLRIADLREGLNHVSVQGEVGSKPMLREVKTSKGELVRLAVFEVKDQTGTTWVSAWRKQAETAEALKVGDQIAMRNISVKRGFGDQLEISTKDATSIIVIPEN